MPSVLVRDSRQCGFSSDSDITDRPKGKAWEAHPRMERRTGRGCGSTRQPCQHAGPPGPQPHRRPSNTLTLRPPPEEEVTSTPSSLPAVGNAPPFWFTLSQTAFKLLNNFYPGLHVLILYWAWPANPICKTSHLFVLGNKCENNVLSFHLPASPPNPATETNRSDPDVSFFPLEIHLFSPPHSYFLAPFLDSSLPMWSQFLQQSPLPRLPHPLTDGAHRGCSPGLWGCSGRGGAFRAGQCWAAVQWAGI